MIEKEVKVNLEKLQNFQDVCDLAQKESLKGYVQHVNKTTYLGTYYVSDWSDGTTVASFENGRKL